MEDLRQKLQHELTKQDVQLDRLDREKQEESNLVAMLQLDIERLNNDRYDRCREQKFHWSAHNYE